MEVPAETPSTRKLEPEVEELTFVGSALVAKYTIELLSSELERFVVSQAPQEVTPCAAIVIVDFEAEIENGVATVFAFDALVLRITFCMVVPPFRDWRVIRWAALFDVLAESQDNHVGLVSLVRASTLVIKTFGIEEIFPE